MHNTYNINAGITVGENTCGSSFAAPQVAGAALLLKDWVLDEHGTFINDPGHLQAMLLAMTDRENGTGQKANSGFHPRWGGGRFQARFFFDPGQESGPWGWESAWSTLSDGETWQRYPFNGANLPASTTQWKAYMWWAEDDDHNAADLVLRTYDSVCTGLPIRGDYSFDVKKMTRLDESVAGQRICVATTAFHIPAGQDRRAHLFNYYTSGGTAFR